MELLPPYSVKIDLNAPLSYIELILAQLVLALLPTVCPTSVFLQLVLLAPRGMFGYSCWLQCVDYIIKGL